MKQSLLFWMLAFLITAGSAVYQRTTGPTYPISGKVDVDGKEISYKLDRSHPGESNHIVKIETKDESISGFVEWKRYKTEDLFTKVTMTYSNGILSVELPHQPPAGKLEYRVTLQKGDVVSQVPQDKSVIIRFRGDVPLLILIVHVLTMFVGMLFATRAGLEVFAKQPQLKKLIYWTIGLLTVGGLILGPIVQWYSFGAFWTGWPFGKDLTDNKTALIVLMWVIAAIALKYSKNSKRWTLLAAIITIVVYLIPHSVLGSELDYSKVDKINSSIQSGQ
ncbi:MAG: hypothetical protein HY964_01410 [Ignavibacteriales bacterium]|nr:hypothetical protein [Ignavibacteriales bacterium]